MRITTARSRRWVGVGLAWLVAGLCLAMSGASLAQSGLRDDAPRRYSVVSGDTLWDIAGRFLLHPWQWPQVWQVNPQISNPHLIYPGDTVYLYYQDGQPRLGLERGQGVVRLSPEVRRTPRREAIPPLPLESVQTFLAAHRILDDPAQAADLAYVVAGDDRRLISGAGDRLYARGEIADSGLLGVYREGERYQHASTGEFLGLELQSIGQARWVRGEGDITLLEVVSAREEVRGGDLVMPLEAASLATEFHPRAPEGEIEGRILSVPGGVHFVGRLDVVALDLGRQDGLAPGHVLAVEQRGELTNDPVTGESLRLPGEEAGMVMVFRSYDRVSYALVMQASRTLSVGDRVHNPERRGWLAQSPARP
ncbi:MULTISPECIES: LysM peptidoglycan-binding domain-containing protein [Halomonadaceae]|uniref:LysM peptidoglycan-binding domain-containing protein n=1 Tax=Halomonadaceae TaxID=28256 RepID=UPI0015980D40|nr:MULTISPECIES: LysM domain-containing protein [Halomonas]QJQ94499.1 LysM peptidoglycan-binding domain-containing protein [Halomonas sp. PA5]